MKLISKEIKEQLIKNGMWGAILFLIVFSFLGTGYYLYAKSSKKPEIFQTEAPFRTNIIKKTVATGSITPRMDVAIKLQVSRLVDKLFVELGDKVNFRKKALYSQSFFASLLLIITFRISSVSSNNHLRNRMGCIG